MKNVCCPTCNGHGQITMNRVYLTTAAGILTFAYVLMSWFIFALCLA